MNLADIDRKRINSIRDAHLDSKVIQSLCDQLIWLLDENVKLELRCKRMFNENNQTNQRLEALKDRLLSVINSG